MGTIPKVSNADLESMLKRIRPVARFRENPQGEECPHCGYREYELEQDDRGDLYYIKKVNPRNVAYTWDPQPAEKAKGLVKHKDITTHHTYGYYGFFKPSIAEVLAQIPEADLETVCAFEYVYGTAEITGEYHSATTRLYRRGGGKHGKT